MSSKRRSYEAGHKRKYLVVIDDTEECDRAVYWAAKRAGRTKSQMVMLRVIEPGDRNQQWLGVADLMKAEAQEAANAALDKFAARAKKIAKITPDRVIREGNTSEEIIKLIDEDADQGDVGRQLCRDRLRAVRLAVARALGPEHESDCVCARLGGRDRVALARDAADLDASPHDGTAVDTAAANA